MKRNIVPLLGIAFVVAIISTGIFYGLFAGKLKSSAGELPGQAIVVAARNLEPGTVLQAGDVRISEVKGSLKGAFANTREVVGVTLLAAVQQNEPLLQDRVASRDGKTARGSSGVPAGMRAVSIRVAESTGIVNLLHPGTRVDVQAVTHRNGGLAELRTVLQNVEVLAVSPQLEATAGSQLPLPVVTVLTRAQDVDLIALADSGARIRVALRNPLDEGITPRRSIALGSLFDGAGGAIAAGAHGLETTRPIANTTWDYPIQLHVRAVGVSPAALADLDSKLTGAAGNDVFHVAAFRSDADVEQLVRRLEQKQELEIVSSWRLTAGVGRPISFRAGAETPCRLRVQFSPEIDRGGKVGLRVKPEISLPRGGGVETRRYSGGFKDDGSFLVKGLLTDAGDRQFLERLYPGHSWSGRQLVILVTSHSANSPATSSLAQKTNRGQ